MNIWQGNRMRLEEQLPAQLLDMELLQGELAKRSLIDYVEHYWPVLEPGRQMVRGWVLEAICEHLEAVTYGDIHQLLITVPPGSMKSLLTRVFWPTWEWQMAPWMRYIGASYAQHLSLRDNRKARLLVQSPQYRRANPVIELEAGQSAKGNFANTETGWMFATSVEGVGTGERGDRFIIDDPHNVKDGESELIRSSTLTWFRETVPSRVNDLDKSAFVIIMQRVHHDDVAQAAIELGYEHLMIPMHYDSERAAPTSIGWRDPRTEDGALMWPDRFSATAVAKLERTLGLYASSAQLEQTPTPRSGGIFKVNKIRTIREADIEGDEITWARAWDLAGTDGGGAYTAGVLVGWNWTRSRVVIADVVRDRLGPGGVRKLVQRIARVDDLAWAAEIVLPQDPGQAGKAQARSFVKDLAGYRIKIELQSGSKETRAEPLAAQMEAGNVDMIEGPWNGTFTEELAQFPLGRYKDQADAVSSGFNRVAPKRAGDDDLAVGGERSENKAKAA